MVLPRMEKKAQGELEEEALILLRCIQEYGFPPVGISQMAAILDRVKYDSEHTKPVKAATARLCDKGLVCSSPGGGYEITPQGNVVIQASMVQPSGFERLHQIRDRLTTWSSRRVSPLMKTNYRLAAPTPLAPSAAASMAVSINSDIKQILWSSSLPLLDQALSDAKRGTARSTSVSTLNGPERSTA